MVSVLGFRVFWAPFQSLCFCRRVSVVRDPLVSSGRGTVFELEWATHDVFLGRGSDTVVSGPEHSRLKVESVAACGSQ